MDFPKLKRTIFHFFSRTKNPMTTEWSPPAPVSSCPTIRSHFSMNNHCGLYWSLIWVFLFSSGCWDTSEEKIDDTPANPLKGSYVSILVPEESQLDRAWAPLLEEWAAQTNASYNIVGTFVSIMSSQQKGETIRIVPLTAIPQLLGKQSLQTIPESEQGSHSLNLDDLYKGLDQSVCQIAGDRHILPLSHPVLLLCYRVDLLKQAKRKPPDTWNEYHQLIDDRDQWATGKSILEPWEGTFRSTIFLAKAISYAKHPENFSLCFEYHSAKPLIDSPGFIKGASSALHIFEQLPEAKTTLLNSTPEDCLQQLLEGKSAMGITVLSAKAVGMFAKVERETKAEFGFVPLPGAVKVYHSTTDLWEEFPAEKPNRVTLTGFSGWVGVVTSTENSTEGLSAGWNVWSHLVQNGGMDVIPRSMKSPTRLSDASRPGHWIGNPFNASERKAWLQAVIESLHQSQVALELPLLKRDRFRDSLSLTITKMIQEQISPDTGLPILAQQWEGIVLEEGKEDFIAIYRQMLGMKTSR